jgi:hypothetical protein
MKDEGRLSAAARTGLAVSPPQLLLLRAALAEGDAALAAWRRWAATTDLETIDADCARLLPLLYVNLRRLGSLAADERLTARYASVYKRTWYRNNLAFRSAAEVIGLLTQRGIETLVLKGAALSILHYRDSGARAMEDVDVLVRPDHVTAALGVLRARGWTPTFFGEQPGGLTEAYLSTHHGTGFRDAKGQSFDLHWYASQDACLPGADDGLWRASVPLTIAGAETRALAASDQLYHVCAHAYASGEAHLRWVADALTLMRGSAIDWSRVVALAEDRRMVLPVRLALSFLRRELDAAVPAEVLERLAARTLPLVDRLEHEHNLSERPFTLGKVALRLWCRHRRSTSLGGWPLLATFPNFLRRTYAIESPWQLPAFVLRRGFKRARHQGLV